jgi:NAD-dependent DNA ligase
VQVSNEHAVRGAIGFRLAHELEGILSGIRADGVINQLETRRLTDWMWANAQFAAIRPFSEIAARVEHAIATGVLTMDECQDLLFVTAKYTATNPYFDAIRGGIQSLMGILAGVTADRMLNELEIAGMRSWLASWSHLRGLWPYDECYAIVTSMLATGQMGDHVADLESLAAECPVGGADWSEPVPMTFSAVCAADPRIEFTGRTFVFTGEPVKAPRAQLAAYVELLGGAEEHSVTPATDYLVVCEEPSALWTFSCDGRKVEQAYQMRRAGRRITLVSEGDFWKALIGQGNAALGPLDSSTS